MAFDYISKHYNVPAEYGREVIIDGRKGVIVEDMGNYIGVNFHGEKSTMVHPCHPTWCIEYLGIVPLPKITASQRRYKEYIELDSGISFREYLGIKKSKTINT